MKAGKHKAALSAARFWVNGEVPPAVAHYLRAVLVRTVERGDFHNVWPLLSLMYHLDEEAPESFQEATKRAKADPESSVRHLTDWARRQARPTAIGNLAIVSPDARRVAEWLAGRVKRPEYSAIFAADLETSWYSRKRPTSPRPPRHGVRGAVTWKAADKGAFGPINCAGLPAHLVESELFGHEKNAFTGANERREGLIARHSRGTVFLDEIGDTPPEVQLRLLRFLNDGETRPVGADTAAYHYPWVIAATHRDLAKQVSDGKFREDLFNRLNGHVLTLKPLRQRGEDLFGALNACLDQHSGSQLVVTMSVPAIHALRGYNWKANLREVDQLARRLVQERAPARRHLSIDIGDLSPEFQSRYFFSTPYMTRLVHQYAEEIKLLPAEERAHVRDSLRRHFRDVLEQGLVPEMRFVRTAAKFALSTIMRKYVDDEALHAKLVRATRVLEERMMRQHEDRLERDLFAVEGLEPPPREALVETMPDLPSWARRALLIVEELSVNPEAWESIRKIEAVLERFTPSIRAAISDLLAMMVEEAKKSEPTSDNEVDRTMRPTWRAVRDDKLLFAKWLAEAGSAKRMGDLFEKDEKTIRERAKEHGVSLPKARKKAR